MKYVRLLRIGLVVGALLVVPALVQGAGFALYEHGARAVGMAGAFGATANDPSAIYFNPAGIAFQDGTQVAGGIFFIKPKTEMYGANPYPGSSYRGEMKNQIFFPPHLYAIGALSDRIHWGVGVYAPFGLGTWWPDEYPGKYISKRINLEVFNINPNVAVKLTDNLALAGGIDYYLLNFDLTKSIGVVNPYTQAAAEVGQVHISTKNQHGWGWNVAMLGKLGGGWSFGASFRSAVSVEIDGNGSFVQFPSGNPDFDAIVGSQIPFGTAPTVTSKITFPKEGRVGLAYHGGPWTAELDIVRVSWSSFKNLPMIFTDYPALTQIRKENYQDANSYRLGFEYRTSPTWAFQWGVLWDESPVPTASVSPLLPDSNRVGFTVGTSYSFSPNLQLDVSFMHLNAKDRSTYGHDYDNFNGLYKTRAELLGFTLVYRL